MIPMTARPAHRSLIRCDNAAVLSNFEFSAVLLGYAVDRLTPHQLLIVGRLYDVEHIADHTGGVAADLWTEDYAPDAPAVTDYRLEDEEAEYPEIDEDLSGWSPLAPILYGARVPEHAWRIA